MSKNNMIMRKQVEDLVRAALSEVPMEKKDRAPEHVIVNSLRDKAEREYDRDESAKELITELDLRGLEENSRLRVAENVKFTPLAKDIISEKNIQLLTKTSRKTQLKVRSVAIGSDHGGFKLKEYLKTELTALGIRFRDFGTDSEEAVDYPDIASEVARSVSSGHVEAGIIIDGAGIGSAMAANKIPGVRAAACYSVALAKNSREHNGANVLSLGAGQNSNAEILAITEAFLSAEITEDRHKRRVEKIDTLDKHYRK